MTFLILEVFRVVLGENLGALGSQGTAEEGDLEMGWTGRETCIKCNEGGKLLGCSKRGCPIAFHEKCISCSAQIDTGILYCPYCFFKRSLRNTWKGKKKAMMAKKGLSGFLNGMIDSELQKETAEGAKGKEPKSSTVLGETDGFVQIEKDQQQGNFNSKCTTAIFPCGGLEISSVNERNKVGLLRHGDNAGLDDHDQNERLVEQQIHLDYIVASGGGDKHSREQYEMVQAAVQAVEGETDHFVQIEKDQQQENFDTECTTGILPCKDVEISAVNEQNRVGLLKHGDYTGLDDHDQNARLVEQQIHPSSIVAAGSGEKHYREEEPGQQYEMVQAAVQAEHHRQGDDNQHDRVVEDGQQAQPFSASPVEDDLNVGLRVPTKEKQRSAERLEKNEGRTVEEEEMQPGHQFEMVRTAERFQVENQRQVQDNQHEKIVEDELHADSLSGSPLEEDSDVALHTATNGKRKIAEMLENNEGRITQVVQQKAQNTISSSSGVNPAPQVHAKTSHLLSKERTFSGGSRHVDGKDQSEVDHSHNVAPMRRSPRILPQNIASPRKSPRSQNVDSPSRLSTELPATTSLKNEKSTATLKPAIRLEKATFPEVRRKKRMWTEEEEEMLMVGVQHYSTTVNKNLPWRKILEFGRDVFDGTRTPADLKDKWRNMGKKNSTD